MPDQCKYESPHDDWRCPEEGITGGNLCIFHNPDLGKDIGLLKTRFQARLADRSDDPLHFDGAIFPDGISFEEIVFDRSVSFYETGFRGRKTSFVKAKFQGQKTSFLSAQFHAQETSFSSAQFGGQHTSFLKAEFYGQEISFWRSKFHAQKTSFFEAQFHARETSFSQTQFSGQDTTFSKSQFHGRAIFKGNEPKDVFLGSVATFEGATFGEKGELIFDWIDLSRVRFLRADLSKIKFLDVTWDHPKARRIVPLPGSRWRSAVHDEALWREARRAPEKRNAADREYLSHLGRLYRALKAYYREAGEHHLVGHFHYGLMEVQWHQKEAETEGPRLKRELKKWISWEAFYRFFSGYGEDYAIAGFWLLGLLLIFAGYYWLLGVLRPDAFSEIHGKEWWRQLAHSLLYSFQAGTLGRVDFYAKPVSLWMRSGHLLESILVPVQFGFFLFALRNRFRR